MKERNKMGPLEELEKVPARQAHSNPPSKFRSRRCWVRERIAELLTVMRSLQDDGLDVHIPIVEELLDHLKWADQERIKNEKTVGVLPGKIVFNDPSD